MKKVLSVSLILLGSLFLAGCDNISEEDGEKDVVKIGVIAPLSGPASGYGEDAVTVFEQAIEEYHAKSPETRVELIIENGACQGKDATSAAQKLVNIDKVDILLGGQCSGETFAAGKITNAAKIVTLSPLSSAPDISFMGDYVFRFWNDSFSSILLGDYASKNLPRLALIVENTDYAIALQKSFSEVYRGEISFEEVFYSEEKDYSILAKRIAQQNIDGIVFISQSESTAGGLVLALAAEGLTEKYKNNIYGAWILSSEAFEDIAGEHLEGMVEVQIASIEESSAKGKDFLRSYREQHDIKSAAPFVLINKEGIDLVLDAITSGHRDSESIRSYFSSLDINNPRDGYFGEYYFDENGDAIGLEYMMQQYRNGEWFPVS